MKQSINYYKENLISTINKLDSDELINLANAFLEARNNQNTIFVFGNGGSGSTASHMVCDIIKGCSYKKDLKFKIICLNDNVPTILAYANDVSYDDVFVEQLKNLMSKDDLVIGISGSGNSENIIRAISYANSNGAKTFGMTGFDGGKLKKMSNKSINANINDMQISEDIHLICLHILYVILSNE